MTTTTRLQLRLLTTTTTAQRRTTTTQRQTQRRITQLTGGGGVAGHSEWDNKDSGPSVIPWRGTQNKAQETLSLMSLGSWVILFSCSSLLLLLTNILDITIIMMYYHETSRKQGNERTVDVKRRWQQQVTDGPKPTQVTQHHTSYWTPPYETSTVILRQDDKNKGKPSRDNSPNHGHHWHKRSVDDPFLTKEVLLSLLHVGNISLSLLSFLLSFLAYKDYNLVLVWMGQSIDMHQILEGCCLM